MLQKRVAEDKRHNIQVITGPAIGSQNLKASAPYDRHNNLDDLLVGPQPSKPPPMKSFEDNVLVRQTTDPLELDPLGMPNRPGLGSPNGSLDLDLGLGSPAAPPKPRDFDELSNHEEGDGLNDMPKAPVMDDRDPFANDFGPAKPQTDLYGSNINRDLDDLYNPNVPKQILPEFENKKAVGLASEVPQGNDKNYQQKSYINQEDILMDDHAILKDMGDIEKKN